MTFWRGWSNWRGKSSRWSTRPPQTHPTHQGASLPLPLLPCRNPQSRRHLAANWGRHAFTNMSWTGPINEQILEFNYKYYLSTLHFPAVLTGVFSSDKWRAIVRHGHPDVLEAEMFSLSWRGCVFYSQYDHMLIWSYRLQSIFFLYLHYFFLLCAYFPMPSLVLCDC